MTTKTFDDATGAELPDRTGYEALVVLADGSVTYPRHFASFDALIDAVRAAAQSGVQIAAVTIRDRALAGTRPPRTVDTARAGRRTGVGS